MDLKAELYRKEGEFKRDKFTNAPGPRVTKSKVSSEDRIEKESGHITCFVHFSVGTILGDVSAYPKIIYQRPLYSQ